MSQDKCTQVLQCRRQAQEAETSAHKPHDTEGKLSSLRESHTILSDTEGRVGELRKYPLKPLTSKFWPAMQRRTGEQKNQQRFQGQVRGLAAAKDMLRRPLSIVAMEIDMSNTAKARRPAQIHMEPINNAKRGHCTALQRDEIQLHHRHKLLQAGKHHRTLSQPH